MFSLCIHVCSPDSTWGVQLCFSKKLIQYNSWPPRSQPITFYLSLWSISYIYIYHHFNRVNNYLFTLILRENKIVENFGKRILLNKEGSTSAEFQLPSCVLFDQSYSFPHTQYWRNRYEKMGVVNSMDHFSNEDLWIMLTHLRQPERKIDKIPSLKIFLRYFVTKTIW